MAKKKSDTPKITMEKPESLKPAPNNARTHTEAQIEQIVNSINEFGFTNPVLIDEKKTILAGHGRVEAAKKIGLSQVPTICFNNLTDDQKRALVIADNRIALNAGWDEEILKLELGLLSDNDFDMSLLGFEDFEIDEYLFLESNAGAGKGGEGSPVFEQSLQLEPAKEYILVVCSDLAEFDEIREVLEMGTVSRGGYKKGSPFDQAGPQRLIKAQYLLERLKNANSNTKQRSGRSR